MKVAAALALCALLISQSPVVSMASTPLLLGESPNIDLSVLQVSVFAKDLDFPMGATVLPDDSLLVGLSNPSRGGYFESTGELRRLVDANNDGEADDVGTVLAGDLPGTIVAVVSSGPFVFVTSAQSGYEQIMVFHEGKTWTDSFQEVGTIDFLFNEANHKSYGLAVRPAPDQQDAWELFFNIGAYDNFASGRPVDVSGLISGSLDDATIYRVTIRDSGGTVTATGPELIATGLRNAAAFIFDPKSGDLIISDNGIDTPENRIIAFSADEFDRIPEKDIGGEPEDFGFPDSYDDYQTGDQVGDRGIAPEIAMTPLDGSENEGIAAIALGPSSFPTGLNSGLFVGFHGQWDDFGIQNEENPVDYVDLTTGERFQFVSNDDPNIGHIDSMASAKNALYLIDLCGGPHGSLAGSEPCGAIYEVRAKSA